MALSRSDGLLYAIGQGYSALDAEAARNRLDGFAVVSGLGVTVSSGLTLSIASGTATVGETSNTVDTVSLGSSTPKTLNAADSTNPRKDTVYIDTSGTVQVETGTAEAYDPSDETLFDTFQPEPPLPSTEGVILAEVVVPAGASSINTTDHVRDRRQPAQAVFDEVTSRAVFTGGLNIAETGTLYDSGAVVSAYPISVTSDTISDSTSSTYERIAYISGGWPQNDMPAGCTLYGRFAGRGNSGSDTEQASVKPRLRNGDTGSLSTIDSLEVSLTDSSPTNWDSGWTQITDSIDDFPAGEGIVGKVESGGTLSLSDGSIALTFAWVIE